MSDKSKTTGCHTCGGRREVGGLLPDGGGYQTDPCPECGDDPIEEYPDNGPTDPWETSGPGATAKSHWTVHYREWVAERPDISKLGLIEQMEAYLKAFSEAEK